MPAKPIEGYDLIGDVHGCAQSLILLLVRLGYSKRNGVYYHPKRQVIFLGDIVDRGPHIREALHLVRDMVDAGHAQIVMGNHEYNLLCFCTPNQQKPGAYLFEHTPARQKTLQETLDQLEAYPKDKADFLAWIQAMPLFLELDSFRVVHACWHSQLIDQFRQMLGGNRMTEAFLQRSIDRNSFEWQVVDKLLRGTHLHLPKGESMVSSDGVTRRSFRTKFWSVNPQTYAEVEFQPDPLPERIANMPLTAEDRDKLVCYAETEKSLFVGHYWRDGEPQPITHNIACLDYSAVKYGKLVAYRYDFETVLDVQKFCWVDVSAEVTRPAPN